MLALLEIWQDFRDENDKKSQGLTFKQNLSDFLFKNIILETQCSDLLRQLKVICLIEVSLKSKYGRLPEPPEMRENLKKEIQLFVTALKQRSSGNGR